MNSIEQGFSVYSLVQKHWDWLGQTFEQVIGLFLCKDYGDELSASRDAKSLGGGLVDMNL
ncbi:MAG: hypothetical protein Pyrs2KO_34780 [Pyruvatibacter sp.]